MISEVYNMDCMEYMKTIPDKHFELAICDPPYGIGDRLCISGPMLQNRAMYTYKNSTKWDSPPSEDYFNELRRVSVNQIIWGGNYFSLPPTRCIIGWDKQQPWETFSQWEMAWTSFDSPASLFKFDNRTGDKIHPTQKPVALYKWLLKKYAKEGDKIFDSHLGSGSSRIACHDMGFEFYGTELDADYFRAMEERFLNHTAQARLFYA